VPRLPIWVKLEGIEKAEAELQAARAKWAIEKGDNPAPDLSKLRQSFKKPESWENTPDERQTLIKIIGGVYVEDNGLIPEGEILSCQVVFNGTNWAIVKEYWHNRTMVAITDHAGKMLGDKRIVVKKYKYVDRHLRFYDVSLEFWSV